LEEGSRAARLGDRQQADRRRQEIRLRAAARFVDTRFGEESVCSKAGVTHRVRAIAAACNSGGDARVCGLQSARAIRATIAAAAGTLWLANLNQRPGRPPNFDRKEEVSCTNELFDLRCWCAHWARRRFRRKHRRRHKCSTTPTRR